MGRLVDGRRVEVRARTAHWARLIPGRRFARFQVGNFRGPQLLFMVAAVEVVSRSTLLELAEPALRDFLVTGTAPEVYLVRLGPQVHEVQSGSAMRRRTMSIITSSWTFSCSHTRATPHRARKTPE